MTPEELERLKSYLRIDHDDEDKLLIDFYKQAGISIKNKVGTIDLENEDASEQFKQACAMLVQHWYDNRQAFRIGNASYTIPYTLESILRELRYCYAGDKDESG